jgi:hypothetical protein
MVGIDGAVFYVWTAKRGDLGISNAGRVLMRNA